MRRRGVAWVLMVEAEAYRRRVVVMVVLIWRRVLRKRAVLGTLGLEVSLGGVVQVGGVGLVGDKGGVVRGGGGRGWSGKWRTKRRFSSLAAKERSQQRGRGGGGGRVSAGVARTRRTLAARR